MKRDDIESRIRALRETALERVRENLGEDGEPLDSQELERAGRELQEAYSLADGHGLEFERYLLRYDLLQYSLRIKRADILAIREQFEQLADSMGESGVDDLEKLQYESLWWCHVLTMGQEEITRELREQDEGYLQRAIEVAKRDSRLKEELIRATAMQGLGLSRWNDHEHEVRALPYLAWVVDAVLKDKELDDEDARWAYRTAREYCAILMEEYRQDYVSDDGSEAPWATRPREVELLNQGTEMLLKGAEVAKLHRDAANFVRLQMEAAECMETIPARHKEAENIFLKCRLAAKEAGKSIDAYVYGLRAGWALYMIEFMKDQRQGTNGVTTEPTDYRKCIKLLEDTLAMFNPQTADITPDVAEEYPAYVERRARIHASLFTLYDRVVTLDEAKALANCREYFNLWGLLCEANLLENLEEYLGAAVQYSTVLGRSGRNHLERFRISQRNVRLIAQAVKEEGEFPEELKDHCIAVRSEITDLLNEVPLNDEANPGLRQQISALVEEFDRVFGASGGLELALQQLNSEAEEVFSLLEDGNEVQAREMLPVLLHRADELATTLTGTGDKDASEMLLDVWGTLRKLLAGLGKTKAAVKICRVQIAMSEELYRCYPADFQHTNASRMARFYTDLMELLADQHSWCRLRKASRIARMWCERSLAEAGNRTDEQGLANGLMFEYHRLLALAYDYPIARRWAYSHLQEALHYCKRCYELDPEYYLDLLAANYMLLAEAQSWWLPFYRKRFPEDMDAFFAEAIPIVERFSQTEGNEKYREQALTMRSFRAIRFIEKQDFVRAYPLIVEALACYPPIEKVDEYSRDIWCMLTSGLLFHACIYQKNRDKALKALEDLQRARALYPTLAEARRFAKVGREVLEEMDRENLW